MDTIIVVMTCYNRKEKTINCIETLFPHSDDLQVRYVVVDDNSTDGTREALQQLPYDIICLQGDGGLFWNGGMHRGLAYIEKSQEQYDYILLVNDDVSFYADCLKNLIEQSKEHMQTVIVGTTQDSAGNLSYGGIQFISKHRIKYHITQPGEPSQCDTFNGNCVLIPRDVFLLAGNIDIYYKHSMGDFDYGMHIKRSGFSIYCSKEYVGRCDDNPIEGSWVDTSLPRKRRMELKESNKGLPYRDWFYFGKKNFGLSVAIYHAITPYIKILFRK